MSTLRPSPLLLAAVLLSYGSAAHAQFWPTHYQRPHTRSNDDFPFSVGGYASFGGQSSTPPANSVASTGIVGIYAELNRNHLHPGLDLRGVVASNSGIGGTLVGPRLAFSYNVLHPYIEGLIGPNHSVQSSTRDVQGITSQFVAGLDIETGPNLRLRLIEYSQSYFSAISGAHPLALSTGIVIHLP